MKKAGFLCVCLFSLSAPTTEVTKLAEVYFNQASWQLNQEDGQLAIADVTFTNFRFRPLHCTISIVGHEFEMCGHK